MFIAFCQTTSQPSAISVILVTVIRSLLLKRVLKSRKLRRRENASRITEVINAVGEEFRGSGNSIGYRQMYQRVLVDHSLVVARETVRIILKTLDPEGVLLRSRHRFRRRTYSVKGPNYMWHLDGYDKLKLFTAP